MLCHKINCRFALFLLGLLVAGGIAEPLRKVNRAPFPADDEDQTTFHKKRFSVLRRQEQSPAEPNDYILVSIPIEALETIPAPVATFLNLPLETIAVPNEADADDAVITAVLNRPSPVVTVTVTNFVATVTTRLGSGASEQEASMSATRSAPASAPASASASESSVPRTRTSAESTTVDRSGTTSTVSPPRSTLPTFTTSSSISSSSPSSPSSSPSSSSSASSSSSSSSTTTTLASSETSDVSNVAPPADDASMSRVPFLYQVAAAVLVVLLTTI